MHMHIAIKTKQIAQIAAATGSGPEFRAEERRCRVEPAGASQGSCLTIES